MDIEVMKQIDITRISTDALIDIEKVFINQKLPQNERIMDFIAQIKNPYCFRCKDTVVKLSFSKEQITLEEKLEELFTSI